MSGRTPLGERIAQRCRTGGRAGCRSQRPGCSSDKSRYTDTRDPVSRARTGCNGDRTGLRTSRADPGSVFGPRRVRPATGSRHETGPVSPAARSRAPGEEQELAKRAPGDRTAEQITSSVTGDSKSLAGDRTIKTEETAGGRTLDRKGVLVDGPQADFGVPAKLLASALEADVFVEAPPDEAVPEELEQTTNRKTRAS